MTQALCGRVSLSGHPSQGRMRRLTVLRQVVLVDPTRQVVAKEANGFRGRTLALDQQRELFRRWTTAEHVHPHEAVVGMLALLPRQPSRAHVARTLKSKAVDQ
ncbi:hypothetical protein [Streptomyces sp. NBC_01361]|uniref:hypothetical protein n=1 Tax=Streptomyces sp. NBC_01361 TaxID=2903838 RepID=UPI002E3645D8|nr:hypothetical protein [Streptomyces sp. NBC_01361]